MSHVTEAGLGALAPYPFLLLGVSWMGCLPEAQELEPGWSLPQLWLLSASLGPGHFLDACVRPGLDLGVRIATSSPSNGTCFPIIRAPKDPG